MLRDPLFHTLLLSRPLYFPTKAERGMEGSREVKGKDGNLGKREGKVKGVEEIEGNKMRREGKKGKGRGGKRR